MEQYSLQPRILTLMASKQMVVTRLGETILPYKTWRVLLAIMKAAPETVSREMLILEIWNGNFYIGEKAINHALWEIRSALGDDARNPRFIKTIPRTGYQWIGAVPDFGEESQLPAPSFISVRHLALAALSCGIVLFSTQLRRGQNNIPSTLDAKTILAFNGTEAVANERQILVRHVQGCKFVFNADEGKRFGTPVFSANGEKLAFQVQKPEGCKLVVFEFHTRKREDFDTCAAVQGMPV